MRTCDEIAGKRPRCATQRKAERTPEAFFPLMDAGVRFGDTPETLNHRCRGLEGTSPVSGVAPRCAPATKLREIDPGARCGERRCPSRSGMTGEGGEKRCPSRSGMTEEADKKKAGSPNGLPAGCVLFYDEFNTRDKLP